MELEITATLRIFNLEEKVFRFSLSYIYVEN